MALIDLDASNDSNLVDLDAPVKPPADPGGGLIASAKQSVGATIKGAGQAAADFIPGVDRNNVVSRYGQSIVDANPTAVQSLGDIADKPLTAVAEATGNAAGSMGGMLGARALGMGITAAAPLTGPLAPVTAAIGQAVSWLAPAAIAALPSFGSIRDEQILADPANEKDAKALALATLGAGAVGAIETVFGPQQWALSAMTKEGRVALAEKFAKLGAGSLPVGVAKAAAMGSAVEGAEELVQNPIEQLAAFKDPTTPENIQQTVFGGAMGTIGGGVLGGGFGAVFRAPNADEAIRAAQDAAFSTSTDTATAAIDEWKTGDMGATGLLGAPSVGPTLIAGEQGVGTPEQQAALVAQQEQERLNGMTAPVEQQAGLITSVPVIGEPTITPDTSGGRTDTTGVRADDLLIPDTATPAVEPLVTPQTRVLSDIEAYQSAEQKQARGELLTTYERAILDAGPVATPDRIVPVTASAAEQRTVQRKLEREGRLPTPVAQQILAQQETPALGQIPTMVGGVNEAQLDNEQLTAIIANPATHANTRRAAQAVLGSRMTLPRGQAQPAPTQGAQNGQGLQDTQTSPEALNVAEVFGAEAQLRTASEAPQPGERVTTPMRAALTQIGRLTGTKVVFVSAEGADGATRSKDGNTVYVNVRSSINPLQVMGHEVTHVLRKKHREAWASIRAAVEANTDDAVLAEFARDYWSVAGKERIAAMDASEDISAWLAQRPADVGVASSEASVRDFLMDEMISDLGGNRWSDPEFWGNVFQNIEEKHGKEQAKTIIQKMVAAVKELIARFMMIAKRDGFAEFNTEGMVAQRVTPEQLKAIQTAIENAYATFISAERTNEPSGYERSAPRQAADAGDDDLAELEAKQSAARSEDHPDYVVEKVEPAGAATAEPMTSERLRALRRAAALLERPRDGVLFRVTEDGKAIATGEPDTKIPQTMRNFARKYGLGFEARRVVSSAPVAGGQSMTLTNRTEAMPLAYREAGALYAAEMGNNRTTDSTEYTRFSTQRRVPGVNQTMPARWPTAAGATPSTSDELLTDIATLRQDQRQYTKAVEAILQDPGMHSPDIVTGTLDEKVDHVIERMKSNLLWLYDQIPEAIRERSKLWYDGARKVSEDWAKRYDITESQAAGALAVLSPQKDWFMNVTMAERVLDIMHTKFDHVFDAKMDAAAFGFLTKESLKTDPEAQKNLKAYAAVKGKSLSAIATHNDLRQMSVWIRAYDEAYHDPKHAIVTPEGGFVEDKTTGKGEPTMRAWGDFNTPGKAASIYFNGSAENINKQLGREHKVRNFYNNIYAPKDPRFLTADTHAVAANELRPLSGADKPVAENFGKTGGTNVTGLSGTYAIHHEAYNRAAAERGVLPREMQSIAWEAIRGLFTEGYKGKKENIAAIDAIWKQVDEGDLDVAEARQQILDHAGGITHPDWWNEDNAEYREVLRDKTYVQQRGVFGGAKVTFEVAPDPRNTELKGRWDALPVTTQNEISHKVAWKIAAKALASFGDENMKGELHQQQGGWMADTNPSLSIWFNKRAAASKIAEFARILGFALNQQSMMRTAPRPFKATDGRMTKPAGVVCIDMPADADVKLIYEKIRGIVNAKGVPYVSGHTTSSEQMAIIHTDESKISTADLAKRIAAVLPDYEVGHNTIHVDFPEKGRNSYGLRGQKIPASESSLRARADQLRAEANVLIEQLVGEQRGPDATGDRPTGESVAQQSLPRYGTPADRHAVSVTGVHYSREQRQTLSSAFFGTGMKGEEGPRVRAAADPRIKRRLYFYANTGRGITPESDVGIHAHSVGLDNVYDMDVDPLKLYVPQRDSDPYRSVNQRMNDFESSVIDAGYDGYMTREFGTGGAVVLLGDHTVPVQYEGAGTRPDAATTPAPKYDDLQLLQQRIAANRALPSGQMSGADWKRLLIAVMPEVDPRWLDNNAMYYKGDLLKGAVQLSETRAVDIESPAFKRWFGDSNVVDEDDKPLRVYHSTSNDFTKFKPSRYGMFGRGVYLTTSDQASIYGGDTPVNMPVYVRLEKPWEIDAQDSWVDIYEGLFDKRPRNGENEYPSDKQAREMLAEMQRLGFDGVRISNVANIEDDGNYSTHFVAFRPEQIKSAISNTGAFSRTDPDITRSEARTPWYYSELARAIDAAPAKAFTTGKQFAAWLVSNTSKLGVKKDEIQWTGITDWLETQGKVTREDVAAYLKQGGIHVEETVLDEKAPGWFVRDNVTRAVLARDFDTDWQAEEWTDANGHDDVTIVQNDEERGSAKFAGYKLPGGENYREVLLTLPPSTELPDGFALKQSKKGYWIVAGPGPLEENQYGSGATKEQALRSFAAYGHGRDKVFKSSHWDQPNVLAHMRVDTVEGTDGKRYLRVQEIQSDWGQKGKKEGFGKKSAPVVSALPDGWSWVLNGTRITLQKDGYPEYSQITDADANNMAELDRAAVAAFNTFVRKKTGGEILSAPFVTDTKAWTALVIKRAIRMAAEEGHDGIVFTTGEQQFDLYGSEEIAWVREGDHWRVSATEQKGGNAGGIDVEGEARARGLLKETRGEVVRTKEDLQKLVERVLSREQNDRQEKITERVWGRMQTEDAGTSLPRKEGMEAFYDQIVPQVTRDVLKKLGAGDTVVGDVAVMETNDGYRLDPDMDDAGNIIDRGLEAEHIQPGFLLSDKLRESAMAGIPLFSEARDRTNLDTANRRMSRFIDAFVTGDVKSSDTQILGDMPVVMRAVGAPDLPLEIDGATLEKVLAGKHKYAITADMMKQLPDGLYDPLALFMQPEGGVRAITELTTDGGNPVVVGVHFTVASNRMKVNRIATVYEYERAGERFMEQAKNLRYVRNEEALKISSTPATPFRAEVVQKARELDANILSESDIVKLYQPARYSTPRHQIPQMWQDDSKLDAWDNLTRKLQDKLIDTKRIVAAIREAGIAIKDKFDPYLQETLFHGRAATAVSRFAEDELRPLYVEMQGRGVKQQDLDDYLWARHATERNAQIAKVNLNMPDGGSGLTDQQATDILAGRAVTLASGRTIQLQTSQMASYAALAARVDAITKRTGDLLVASGLESQETVNKWRSTYGKYVPLMRDMEADDNYLGAMGLGMGTGQGFNVRGSASKRAQGSQRDVVDVLANVAMQRERAITRAEKNRVSTAVYGLALTAPNPEFWLPINPDSNNPALQQKVENELVAMGLSRTDAAAIAKEPTQTYIDQNGMVAQRVNPQLRGRENVLALRVNGQDRYVFFSSDERAQQMVRNLKNLDNETMGEIMSHVATVTRYFSSINTQFNPVFGLTNGIRDLGTGMLNLSSTPLKGQRKRVLAYAVSALRGVYSDLRDHRAGRQPTSRWALEFEEFQREGGQTGYRDMFATSKDRAEAIAKEIQNAGKGKSLLALDEKRSPIFGWLSDYNTSIENAIRLAAYKVAKEDGMSTQRAAELAKNLTVNFNKKGLAATQAGAMYAFFNAAVQGTARIGATMIKRDPQTGKVGLTDAGKKIAYGGVMFGVMQALLLSLAGYDDEEPPQFIREKNIIIPMGYRGKYVSLPMPLGFHVIPNLGRIPTEFVLNGFRKPGERLVQLFRVIADAFNPIGSSTPLQMVTPTIVDPLAALAENKDWSGKSIYKEDFNKMEPTAGWTRKKDTASDLSKWLSYSANYVTGGGKYGIGVASPTPDQIDYLIGQATGGVGRESLKLWQAAKTPLTGEELPMYKFPVLGRFAGNTSGQESQASKFYDNLKRIGEHDSALKEIKRARDSQAYAEYMRENPDARQVKLADKASRDVSLLKRQKREALEKGDAERVKLIERQLESRIGYYNKLLSDRRE